MAPYRLRNDVRNDNRSREKKNSQQNVRRTTNPNAETFSIKFSSLEYCVRRCRASYVSCLMCVSPALGADQNRGGKKRQPPNAVQSKGGTKKKKKKRRPHDSIRSFNSFTQFRSISKRFFRSTFFRFVRSFVCWPLFVSRSRIEWPSHWCSWRRRYRFAFSVIQPVKCMSYMERNVWIRRWSLYSTRAFLSLCAWAWNYVSRFVLHLVLYCFQNHDIFWPVHRLRIVRILQTVQSWRMDQRKVTRNGLHAQCDGGLYVGQKQLISVRLNIVQVESVHVACDAFCDILTFVCECSNVPISPVTRSVSVWCINNPMHDAADGRFSNGKADPAHYSFGHVLGARVSLFIDTHTHQAPAFNGGGRTVCNQLNGN